MMQSKTIAALLFGLAALGALPLRAQFRSKHYSLTSGQVAHSLARTFAERGITISDSQVSLPANVVASDPEPVLEVRSIEPLGHLATNRPGEVSSAIKLACHDSAACLPFYAIVAMPQGASLNTQTQAIAAAHETAARSRNTPVQYTIRAGAHATLLMDDSATHIQMSVVTLENGTTGQTIRVSSPDHKQTYNAQVVSADVLKGSL
ncbi:MAG TPA: hypothetical protein VGN16_13610 [Acidobacteriaceae bacterium]|jgi:hypothetical protein